MNDIDYQTWITQMEKLTPLQRQKTIEKLARLHPAVVESTCYTDEEPIVVIDQDPIIND